MALNKREKLMLKVLAVVLIASGIILYLVLKPSQNNEFDSAPGQNQTQNTSSSRRSAPSRGGSGGGASHGINLSEFEQHNSINDCWVILDGAVYDITQYLRTIPDAQQAAAYCGTFAFQAGYLGGSSLAADAVAGSSILIGSLK
jgi:hypothetical protein